ncbi:HlyD family efflux transporter periplasmic adaptor subunit [Ancylobacter sp. A5.8]|uniref:HlyD family secretion protein n=1 Tax=Ancylobacter gelatini TaxID=2919920 RepID=UPI001F4E8939|nr:HlyD family efflux transporter periplasmic adaptor subunit [Ancylobacter gelatini]MCJ8142994.1 HlyD family efflux transporter periplasmic adaptor subunit [Ancylobacter gelatini]
MMRMIGVLVCVLILTGCGERGAPQFQGYAESDLIFVGPDEAGRLLTLKVDEGDRVTPGQPLFEVDPVLQQADVDAARGQLAQAQANLDNLKASAQRPEEIAVLEASRRRAQAALDLSQIELDRQKDLYEKKVGSKAAYDTAQATYNQNQAALNEVERQIEVGRMASRDQQVAAAEQAVAAAKASLDAAQTRLDRRALASTHAGSVETVYFRPGELVPVGRPVISVLPPELIKVRFFVPEPDLPRFRLGASVEVTCDGCAVPIPAKVSFISASAEYTPPVIYSLDERSKLVFLLEAKPDDPLSLRPGQPVSVGLSP